MLFSSLHGHFLFQMAFMANGANWTLNSTESILKNSFLWCLQRSKFASAVGKCRGFCQGISTFFSICLGKKNVEAIEWWWWCFSNKFQTCFHWGRSFIVHIFLYSLSTLLFSYISSKKLDIERILTLPYSHKWQKFNKTNERKTQECQSADAEYVAEQINSLTL